LLTSSGTVSPLSHYLRLTRITFFIETIGLFQLLEEEEVLVMTNISSP